MPFPTIVKVASARTIIRPVTAEDIPDLLDVNGDEEVTRFLPYPSWLSLDDGMAWLGRMEGLAQAGSAQQLVVQRIEDGKVLGGVLLFKHEPGSARLEIGYVLGRRHWRQGFAREALAATCGHLFREAGIRRLEAEVNPDNAASCALLHSLGFTLEGRLRQRWVGKGRSYDTCIYGCLSSEWPPARPTSLGGA